MTYLAVLRFLALHRNIKWQLTVVLGAILRLTGLRRLPWSEKDKARTATKVRWGETTTSPAKPTLKSSAAKGKEIAKPRPMVDARFVYALLLIIVLRTPSIRKTAKVVLLDVPSKVVPKQVLDFGTRLFGPDRGLGTGGRARKRDVVKGLIGLGGYESLRGRLKLLGCRDVQQ